MDLIHHPEERLSLPALEQCLAQLAGAVVFTTLDVNSGFWQIPLDRESALLTTFIIKSYMKPSWHGKADRHAATRI